MKLDVLLKDLQNHYPTHSKEKEKNPAVDISNRVIFPRNFHKSVNVNRIEVQSYDSHVDNDTYYAISFSKNSNISQGNLNRLLKDILIRSQEISLVEGINCEARFYWTRRDFLKETSLEGFTQNSQIKMRSKKGLKVEDSRYPDYIEAISSETCYEMGEINPDKEEINKQLLRFQIQYYGEYGRAIPRLIKELGFSIGRFNITRNELSTLEKALDGDLFKDLVIEPMNKGDDYDDVRDKIFSHPEKKDVIVDPSMVDRNRKVRDILGNIPVYLQLRDVFMYEDILDRPMLVKGFGCVQIYKKYYAIDEMVQDKLSDLQGIVREVNQDNMGYPIKWKIDGELKTDSSNLINMNIPKMSKLRYLTLGQHTCGRPWNKNENTFSFGRLMPSMKDSMYWVRASFDSPSLLEIQKYASKLLGIQFK